MNKILALLFFTNIILPSFFAQNSIGAGIRSTPFYSSLGKFMNEDHLIRDGWGVARHDSRTYLFYGLGFDYQFDKDEKFNQLVQFTIGHRFITERLDEQYSESGHRQSTNYNQLSYCLNYLLGDQWKIGRFSFAGYLGASVQRIGKGHQDWRTADYNIIDGQKVENYITTQRMTTAGGWGLGIVSNLELSYEFNTKISIVSSFANYFSFLFFLEEDHYVGEYLAPEDSLFPSNSWDYKSKNKDLRLGFSRISPSLMFRIKLN